MGCGLTVCALPAVGHVRVWMRWRLRPALRREGTVGGDDEVVIQVAGKVHQSTASGLA